MQRCVLKGALGQWVRGRQTFVLDKASRCIHSSSAVHRSLSSLLTGSEREPESTLSFATCQADKISQAQQYQMHNLVQGEWQQTSKYIELLDPLNGEKFIRVPDTSYDEILPFVQSLQACSKSGLHNPLKNPERYLLYGDVCAKSAYLLKQPQVETFFAQLIQRVSPKSFAQATAEVTVTQKFLENFSGDQVRFLARSFAVPGNHPGQQSTGLRWPYGPVAIITPFNFPLEIPVLQLLGALFMGNKPLLKVDSKVSIVMEQFIRLLHECGMPLTDMDFINSDGPVMNKLLLQAEPKTTLFTGSSKVAEKLAVDLKGRVKLEDAGFDWKILGPDVQNEDYVAWTCDQDAYACSGQKCSAQSILFVHENWAKTCLVEKLKDLASRRKLEDLTVGPVLTVRFLTTKLTLTSSCRPIIHKVTTKRMLDHIDNLLTIPGARLEFGGKPLQNHTIPEVYGALEPTAVFVPLKEILKDEESFSLVTTEIFGPFQILTEYKHEDIPLVLEACERMHAHLTAAVVSNDLLFLQEILSNTVNGTTYAGIRARTTGAPQNHWFGPAGDPRGAGIGTPEAIKLVWSCHREIIQDVGPILNSWKTPPCS